MRRLILTLALIVCATAWVTVAATADGGPSPGVDQAGEGIVSPSGGLRYLALPAWSKTIVEVVRVRGGLLKAFRILDGRYGIPYVTNRGDHGGLSRDGRLLVLGDAVCCGLRTVSRFVLLDTKRLRTVGQIVLRGDFSYDALSPDAGTLYLIQHTSARDYTRYRVRAYDLGARRLLPGAIVDREEPKEVMSGYPLARVARNDGSWVYTLYAGGKMPFVHALDTVDREAVCIDLEWRGSQNRLWQMRLRTTRDQAKLLLVGRGGRVVLSVDAPR